MTALVPMALYGLAVPAGDVPMPARPEVPSAFRITMAAIDPSAEAEGDEGVPPRATLKILRQPLGLDDYDSDDEDDEDFDVDEMERMIAEGDDDDDDDDDEGEVNGGPSDPAKSKKALKAAAQAEIKKLLEADAMDIHPKQNGVNGLAKSAKAKGKMPASDEDDDEDDDDEDMDEDEGEIEEFVICTLDPSKNYQQPLDITVGEDERVWFQVSGTHTIYLTGNYVDLANDRSRGMYDPDDDDDEYDLEPDSDELDEEDEEDELDDMEDPRVTELDDDEEPPKLIKTKLGKASTNNKRSAPESDDALDGLDEMIAAEKEAAINGEVKLSKKQLKKQKKNDGSAVAVAKTEKAEAPSSTKSDKKVQFAKQLEQGPTPTKATDKASDKEKSKAALGVKVVQGVTIDDKKLGTGPAAKSGDRIGMRYIGKLAKDGKVFDSNKKGKPFSFKLGAGEVIKGWEIGIQGMSTGGERRITIPAHLAYGAKGAPPAIPGNASLIFDVKLMEISKGK